MQTKHSIFASSEEIPGDLTEVGRFSTRRAAEDRALVVLAMGLPYWLLAHDGSFQLCVETPTAAAVNTQIALFDAEESRRGSALPEVALEKHSGSVAALAIVGAILAGVFVLQKNDAPNLATLGRLDAFAIFARGEWWRAITSLTLHADLPHLLGNLAGAALFGHFATRRFGAGLAWLLILVAGTLGNFFTAWIYRDVGHLALGASTAVFGALGLLAGCAASPARARRFSDRNNLPRLRAILAASILLAMLGGGSSTYTDTVAHLAGFCAGLALGFVAGTRSPRGSPRQAMYALGAIAVASGAWVASLSHAKP